MVQRKQVKEVKAKKPARPKVDHEYRWGLIVELGKAKTARLLEISPTALNSTIKKYKNWAVELPFNPPIEEKEDVSIIVLAADPATSVVPEGVVMFMPMREEDCVRQVERDPIIPAEAVVEPIPQTQLEDQTQIERITNEDYDERFYKHTTKINPITGNNYFPSFSFLHSQGAPASSFLSDWYKDKAWYSEIIFRKRQESGTYTHNAIDAMIKTGVSISVEDIDREIKHSAYEVKNALLGFMNWVEEYKPIVVASEHMVVSEEMAMAGTLDLVARINKDDYKTVYAIDFKTSKSIFDEHRMQVEVYRRMQVVENCAILQLGNSTKKKFTFSPVTAKDREEMFAYWLCIKNTAYHKLLSEGWIQPRENPFPKEFKFIQS